MPRPALRSRSLRKRKARTPGGVQVNRYGKRRPSPAHCGSCKTVLAGVPRLNPATMRKLPKSKRRPERPFGGVLCASCVREQVKQRMYELGGQHA